MILFSRRLLFSSTIMENSCPDTTYTGMSECQWWLKYRFKLESSPPSEFHPLASPILLNLLSTFNDAGHKTIVIFTVRFQKSVFLKSPICFCSEHLLFLHVSSGTISTNSAFTLLHQQFPLFIGSFYQHVNFSHLNKIFSWHLPSSYCSISLSSFITKHLEINSIVVI